MGTLVSARKGKILKAAVVVGTLAALQLAGAHLALAATGDASGAFAPLQTAVQMIVDFITGPFGRLLAIIAVISLGFLAFGGFGCFSHELPLGHGTRRCSTAASDSRRAPGVIEISAEVAR